MPATHASAGVDGDKDAVKNGDVLIDNDPRIAYGTFSVVMEPKNRVHTGDAVFLTSHLNTNIGVQDGHFWTSANQGDWERIYVEKADTSSGISSVCDGDKVFLRSANPNGQYGGMITVDQDGKYGTSTQRADWQTFLVQKRVGPKQGNDAPVREGDQIYLKPFNNVNHDAFADYISVDNSGNFCLSTSDGDDEAFTVVLQNMSVEQ